MQSLEIVLATFFSRMINTWNPKQPLINGCFNWMMNPIFTLEMVGNHQTSTLNWLFGVPGSRQTCLIHSDSSSFGRCHGICLKSPRRRWKFQLSGMTAWWRGRGVLERKGLHGGMLELRWENLRKEDVMQNH